MRICVLREQDYTIIVVKFIGKLAEMRNRPQICTQSNRARGPFQCYLLFLVLVAYIAIRKSSTGSNA